MLAQDKKVHLVSLGCARNRVDSEVMLGSLLKDGWSHTLDPLEADVVVVNTCGFIEAAKEESIDTILGFAAHKKAKRNFKLVVTGCLSQRYKTQLAKGLPEVDFFLGTDQFTKLAHYLEEAPASGTVIAKRSNYLYDARIARVNTLSPQSAYVKVAEGCQHNCSFCIIPAIRGELRSRTIASVVNEAKNLVRGGVKELILIAQDLAAFGRERGGDELLSLLKALVAIEGVRWIRPLYVYPENISDSLIDVLASEEKLVKYLDVPVQHASSRILKGMNRELSRQEMAAVFARLRQRIPDIAIRTTVMVGFPGETENDFAELKDFVAEQRFTHLGCFTYSPEEGTRAARMPDHVAEEVKQRRWTEIMELQRQIVAEDMKLQVGKLAEAIVEGVDHANSCLHGRLSTQAPEVDGTVTILSGGRQEDLQTMVGEIVTVRISEIDDYDLVAVVQ